MVDGTMCVRCAWWEGDERHTENQYAAACVALRTLTHADDGEDCSRFTDAATAMRRVAVPTRAVA